MLPLAGPVPPPSNPRGSLVFISCGQFTVEEKRLGNAVKAVIEGLTSCEGYFAENQNSLLGLSQHIFGALNRARGLVAIMHHRGRVETHSGEHVRGSVWVEQEIAISAFLAQAQGNEMPVLIYIQRGIKREGVREQLLLSPVEFETDEELLTDLRRQITTGAFAPCVAQPNPVRSSAEQRNFEIARSAIEKHGDAAVKVLRHLKTVGKYAVGNYSPPPPVGLTGAQTREMLNTLVGEQLVRYDITNHTIDERTYEIAHGMGPVLNELLYP
jgi:hypothetical protein